MLVLACCLVSVACHQQQDWNTPGKLWCDGARQEAVFKACRHINNNSSSSSAASKPLARGVPVAAAVGSSDSSNDSSGSGGGAIHVVPAGSSHGSFTDLPFLLNAWVSNQLRRLVSS